MALLEYLNYLSKNKFLLIAKNKRQSNWDYTLNKDIKEVIIHYENSFYLELYAVQHLKPFSGYIVHFGKFIEPSISENGVSCVVPIFLKNTKVGINVTFNMMIHSVEHLHTLFHIIPPLKVKIDLI